MYKVCEIDFLSLSNFQRIANLPRYIKTNDEIKTKLKTRTFPNLELTNEIENASSCRLDSIFVDLILHDRISW
jgi:hypothetical protein